MDSHEAIRDFVNTYQAYSGLGATSDDGATWLAKRLRDDDAAAWEAMQRVDVSEEARTWLTGVLSSAPSGTQWSHVPILMYQRYSWEEMSLPLVHLLGYRGRLLRQSAREFVRDGLWLFASAYDDAGYYAADIAAGARGDVWMLPLGTQADGVRRTNRLQREGPLASSMQHLLDAERVLMEDRSLLKAGDLTALRDALASVDPVMGGGGWDKWWGLLVSGTYGIGT